MTSFADLLRQVPGYARQIVQDGTGKAAEPAKEFVGKDDFLLTYGDILVKPDTYEHMLRRFREAKFSGLVTVTGSEVGEAKTLWSGATCKSLVVWK